MKPKRGSFFAVDQHAWAEVCAKGMNAAVAYLVLACFSGRDNRITAASVQAIEKYTGIARSRARAAIDILISARLISQIQGGTKPRYDLLPSAEIVEAPDWIWLPNALVTGAAGEHSPVERVRQTQDVMTLRLLVDLYHEQNLREDGGISRRITWQRFERVKVGEQAQYVVWGFCSKELYVNLIDVAECHKRMSLTAAEKKAGANQGVDFFCRSQQLTDLLI